MVDVAFGATANRVHWIASLGYRKTSDLRDG
jgi:hypothetical protein